MKRFLAALLLVAACGEEQAEAPGPVALTDDAVSHFCLMDLSGHGGPKAQIHLEGFPAPIFFAQVRDGLGYLKGAERDAPILAVYVSDMGRAPNWEAPGAENWIAAEAAHYVVGSDATGGMGAPEIVPFGAQEDARAFAAKRGGRVVSLADIPDDAVFGPVSIALPGADG